MQPLETAEDVLRYFQESKTPIFYASTYNYNIINVAEYINNIKFINTEDPFDGRNPDVFVPPLLPSNAPVRIEAANNLLLSHPAVANHVRSWGPGGKVLFLMFDEETERLAKALGLEVCFPTAALRHHLDSKLTTTRLATEAGVASVPHVLARVKSYWHLREVARDLGPDLVVQLPHGDSGITTFFISSAVDYRRHARAIAGAREVKIMRRIRCRPLTIEGCVTRYGTLVGPLMMELTGHPALTPFRGGWCGNELAGYALAPDLRLQARRATEALGQRLAQAGYRGYFGLDYLLDQDTGDLYLGELNPRITGVTPLTSQAALDAGDVPLSPLPPDGVARGRLSAGCLAIQRPVGRPDAGGGLGPTDHRAHGGHGRSHDRCPSVRDLPAEPGRHGRVRTPGVPLEGRQGRCRGAVHPDGQRRPVYPRGPMPRPAPHARPAPDGGLAAEQPCESLGPRFPGPLHVTTVDRAGRSHVNPEVALTPAW